MGPDARVLLDKARKLVQEYKKVYLEEPSVATLVKELAGIMQEYTQSGYTFGFFNMLIVKVSFELMHSGVRPFGVSLLIAGFDKVTGPALYQVDPSGSFFAWKATAIGKDMINAKTFLEKR